MGIIQFYLLLNSNHLVPTKIQNAEFYGGQVSLHTIPRLASRDVICRPFALQVFNLGRT